MSTIRLLVYKAQQSCLRLTYLNGLITCELIHSFRPVDYPPSKSHCFIFLIRKDRGFFCKEKKGEPPKSCLFTKAFVGVIIDLKIC